MTEVRDFGRMPDGRSVQIITLSGVGKLTVQILTYGATLQSLFFDQVDTILGYDTLDGYLNADGSYLGATIGRYANRISNGKFSLGGVDYNLGCNRPGGVHLHGGHAGLDGKVFDYELLDGDCPKAIFRTHSPDGESGYPGNLDFSVTYSITPDNVLRIEYAATADKDTIFNPTNHAYFNLSADGTILDTVLQIRAEHITRVSGEIIPTGELLPVSGTPFDFNLPKRIDRDMHIDHEQMRICNGYDVNYALSDPAHMKHAASARSERTGIRLDCYTTEPGVQLYVGGLLDEPRGKGGVPYTKNMGFCLETQHFPDSPNRPEFPSVVLKSGERFGSTTEYRFSHRSL